MKRYVAPFFLIAAAGVLIAGFVWLFEQRFETGDVYPAYSSLRADPLGVMALYESLEKLRGVAVERDYSTQNLLPEGTGTTYLHIAAPIGEWRLLAEQTLVEMERFVSNGGRLVVTMYPVANKPPAWRESLEQNRQSGKEEKPKPTPRRERWGIDFEVVDLEQQQGEYLPVSVENQSGLALPQTLDWHSGIILTNVTADWKPIYSRGSGAVMVERRFGRGAVVIATDSYFLSNEAMQRDRHADLLAWLIGPNRAVVFDEAHLGVTESPGVATLMRRYRLHWFAAALAGLAALFVWKNSVSLLPAREGFRSGNVIAGKDATSGFINLLRRSIPSRDIFTACFTEWKASTSPGSYSATRLHQAQAMFEAEQSLPVKERKPVNSYRRISKILHERAK